MSSLGTTVDTGVSPDAEQLTLWANTARAVHRDLGAAGRRYSPLNVSTLIASLVRMWPKRGDRRDIALYVLALTGPSHDRHGNFLDPRTDETNTQIAVALDKSPAAISAAIKRCAEEGVLDVSYSGGFKRCTYVLKIPERGNRAAQSTTGERLHPRGRRTIRPGVVVWAMIEDLGVRQSLDAPLRQSLDAPLRQSSDEHLEGENIYKGEPPPPISCSRCSGPTDLDDDGRPYPVCPLCNPKTPPRIREAFIEEHATPEQLADRQMLTDWLSEWGRPSNATPEQDEEFRELVARMEAGDPWLQVAGHGGSASEVSDRHARPNPEGDQYEYRC